MTMGTSMFLAAAAAPSQNDAGTAAVLGASLRAVFGETGAMDELRAAYTQHRPGNIGILNAWLKKNGEEEVVLEDAAPVARATGAKIGF